MAPQLVPRHCFYRRLAIQTRIAFRHSYRARPSIVCKNAEGGQAEQVRSCMGDASGWQPLGRHHQLTVLCASVIARPELPASRSAVRSFEWPEAQTHSCYLRSVVAQEPGRHTAGRVRLASVSAAGRRGSCCSRAYVYSCGGTACVCVCGAPSVVGSGAASAVVATPPVAPGQGQPARRTERRHA